MKKPNPVIASVIKVERLSTNVQRILLQSQDFKNFPKTQPGAYIKLMFNHDGSAFTGSGKPSMMRTYTVRQLDIHKGVMTIDFALHGGAEKSGPASDWAQSARPGDRICLAGPGSVKALQEQYAWVLFAGDLTALPAIESHLAQLPTTAEGYAVIKVGCQEDIRPIVKPQKVKVLWLTDPKQRLANTIRQLEIMPGNPAIWAASEFSQMREMRKLFSREWNIPRSDYYISSYWKMGRSEEQHKIDKRNDQEALAA